MTKTPEQWLEEVSPQERNKGILKLFLGYAPGVGKTFSMLSEAIRRRSRDEDVVIGVVETHGRKGIADLAAQLEQVPRRRIEYKGTVFEEMDPDAIIARNPRVILVDELAHTNIPGSKHRKRYEDVLDLVEAKMEVLSTVNVQHLECIAPTVAAITGIKIRETVPDWVLEHANEIVMVDLTPEALQNRMKRGEVYHTGKVDQALKNFFRRGNLIALRELALRQVAEQVDRSLETYMEQKDIHDPWPVRERIAVCFSSNPRGAVPDRSRRPNGSPHGCRVVRDLRRYWAGYVRTGPQFAQRQYSVLGKFRRKSCETQRQRCFRRYRGVCARETHDSSHFRPVCRGRLEEVPLYDSHSPFLA